MTRYRAENLDQVILNYRLRRSAVSFTKTAHGRVNAELVASIIDRWKPGQPFVPTPEQRQQADAAIAACDKPSAPHAIESAYHCRVGRELLRGRQWRRALRHYGSAMKSDWKNRTAYLGMASAVLHYGAEPKLIMRNSSK